HPRRPHRRRRGFDCARIAHRSGASREALALGAVRDGSSGFAARCDSVDRFFARSCRRGGSHRRDAVRGRHDPRRAAVRHLPAGRAVVFSGTAVAVGLSLLLFMPLPFMRGFGVCLAIPLVSVLCALTFLPVLLYYLGDRFDRVRLVPRRLIERREDEEHNMWARLARTIMRRPVLVASVAIVLLLAATAPVMALQLGPGSNQGIPQNLQAVEGN